MCTSTTASIWRTPPVGFMRRAPRQSAGDGTVCLGRAPVIDACGFLKSALREVVPRAMPYHAQVQTLPGLYHPTRWNGLPLPQAWPLRQDTGACLSRACNRGGGPAPTASENRARLTVAKHGQNNERKSSEPCAVRRRCVPPCKWVWMASASTLSPGLDCEQFPQRSDTSPRRFWR
jgi:hypothetical protein